MNNVYIVIIVTLLFVFGITYSKMLYKMNKAQKELSRLIVNVVVLEEYIKTIEENKIQSDESIHKENFIKFLSDSRDWAYQYIEEVQAGLGTFIDAVNNDIEHFDKFGDVLATGRPDYDAMTRISSAYKQLKTLLPEAEDAKD